ncbi:acyl dehydratase [Bradyrhizobium sp. Pear77]|uniref:MaoC/PaaZ C-terminal domain-containing protein n=1 Tax=Bradyrhizobium TaxID=374 RepID=UPI001E52B7FF|nr:MULTISPECIES: MaoC/PaaZ C-terminal domain-containing protein [Bradyrhizobium]MCC8958119.1 acyl dehydratase [Bradyrhizobium altum]MCC8967172.1 acyl dehydratase [Bradyrhizobium oropedii]
MKRIFMTRDVTLKASGSATASERATPLFLEDLSVGYAVTTGEWLVTKDDIVSFARDWDPQPFHLDERAAKDSFFGRLVGSGIHTYAITMRLCVDAGIFTGNAVAGLGFDQLRFGAPVYPGNSLLARLTVASLRVSKSKPEFGVVNWHVNTSDENGRSVLSVVATNLFRRKIR